MNEVIYSVSELNLMIKGLLEGNRTFTNIQIQGEISNFKRYSSGHCYFTLKDAGGVLKAVMFRNQARSLRFEPQNGDTVVAIGRVGVVRARWRLSALYRPAAAVRCWRSDAGL